MDGYNDAGGKMFGGLKRKAKRKGRKKGRRAGRKAAAKTTNAFLDAVGSKLEK